MSSILIFCDHVYCPLHTEWAKLDNLRDAGLDLPDYETARESEVLCHLCSTADPKRTGRLIYVPQGEFMVVAAAREFGEDSSHIYYWQRVPRRFSSTVPRELDGTASHDPDATPEQGTPVGVVLDVLPYGSYILRLDDSDTEKKYGPRQDDLPDQTLAKPDYIKQLQDHLMFLCYWNTLRALPKSKGFAKAAPGVFHYSMVGSVLALKEDLATFYGIPTSTDLDATRISLDSGSKLALNNLNLPIYYDPELHNPVLVLFEEVLDPIMAALDVALEVAKKWPKMVEKRTKGKLRKVDRKPLKKLVEATSTALSNSQQAIQRAKSLSIKRAAPVTAQALLANKVFDIERNTGKKNWTGFENTVIDWQKNRNMTDSGGGLEACLSALNTFVPADDEHEDVVDHYNSLHSDYPNLFIELAAALPMGWDFLGGIPDAFTEYRAKIREFGVVDWATAAYIHAMVRGIPVGGTGALKRSGGLLAFRLPDEGIDVGVQHNADTLYPMAIDAALNAEVPPAFVIERFGGESGFEHTYTVKKMAATKAHKGVRLPKMGTDYANWCPAKYTKATFNWSELFSRGPADWKRGGGRGFSGPLIMSRGWGISQATRGTFVPGVTPKNRKQKVDGFNWILGLPVPPDNSAVELPDFIGSTAGGLRDGIGIFKNKFDKATRHHRDCTFVDAGGKKFDCPNCLRRYDIEKEFKPVGKKITTYRLDVSDERFLELVGWPRSLDKDDGVEFPCSWLTTIMRYAGAGERAFKRMKTTAKTVTNPPQSGDLARYLEKLSDLL